MSPQVRSYVQSKKTVLHCRALEQLVTLEELRPCGAQQRLTALRSSIGAVQMLRKSRDRVIATSVQGLVWHRENFHTENHTGIRSLVG